MKFKFVTEGEFDWGEVDPAEQEVFERARASGDLASYFDYFVSKAHGYTDCTIYVDGVDITREVYG